MNKKAKVGLIIGIVALVSVLTIVLVLVFMLNRDNRHEHTLMHVQAVDATCTEDGSVEYWTCSECGKNFADMDAAKELDTIIVPALGHDFGEYSVIEEATCTEAGEEVAACSRCDVTLSREIEALGHTWNGGEVTTPATCFQEGVMTYTCGRCDEIRTEKIERQPHTPGEEVREYIINASCETAGSYDIVVYCTVCNEEISRNTQSIAALGHSWGNGTQIKAPTCTETGTRVYTCSRCNDSREESVAALGHDWNDGMVMTEPTCTAAGVRLFECSRCDETKTESISALGHDPADAVRENEVATSCEDPGSYDLVVYCDRCGEEISREHVEVAVLGHNWDEGEVTREPTCTVEGVRTFTCTRCSDTREETIELVPHNYVWVIDKNATCIEEGSRHQECSVCHLKLEGSDETIATIAHSYQVSAQLSDYSECEGGRRISICSVCNDVLTEQLSGEGHNYADGICTSCGEHEPTNIFTVSSVSGSAGGIITVTITLGGVVKTSGFVITFNYDSDSLTYISYSSGQYPLTVNASDAGTVTFMNANSANYTNGGTVITMTFLVNNNAESGSSSLNATVTDIKEVWKDYSIHDTNSSVIVGQLTIE